MDILTRRKPKAVYKNLLARQCQIGQPVVCGFRRGRPVSALRLCASMRLAVEALSSKGRGSEAVITGAIDVLNELATLF